MNRKQNFLLITLSLMLIFSFSVVSVQATEIRPFASTAFKKSSISLSTSGNATFSATVDIICDSISVSGCTLQQKSGTKWVDAKSLTPPDSMSNTFVYSKSKDYSSSMTSGKTYRIKATFNADGTTLTKYSGSINYK